MRTCAQGNQVRAEAKRCSDVVRLCASTVPTLTHVRHRRADRRRNVAYPTSHHSHSIDGAQAGHCCVECRSTRAIGDDDAWLRDPGMRTKPATASEKGRTGPVGAWLRAVLPHVLAAHHEAVSGCLL